jgi:8-oxo-dGTP diphosphatase
MVYSSANATVLLVRRGARRLSYPGLWSFPGGHVEPEETLSGALVRELQEEIAITPVTYTLLGSIKDATTPMSDPAVYYMYRVEHWEGGGPTLVGDEHSELMWKTFEDAASMPGLALQEYQSLFAKLK